MYLKKYEGLNRTIEYSLVQEIYRTTPENIDFDNLTHYNGLFSKKEAESLDLFGKLINKYKKGGNNYAFIKRERNDSSERIFKSKIQG